MCNEAVNHAACGLGTGVSTRCPLVSECVNHGASSCPLSTSVISVSFLLHEGIRSYSATYPPG
jgi:hypothetical protein